MRHTILMFKAVLILCMVSTQLQAQSITITQDSTQAIKKFQFGIVGEIQTGSVDLNHAPLTRSMRADGYSSKNIGLVLEYNFNKFISLGIQPKVALNKYLIRHISEEGYDEEEIKSSYLQLPLYATYTYEFRNSSPFLSFGMAPNFKIYDDEMGQIETSAIFFEGFVKIGVDIKEQGLTISPFLSLNNSFTDVYKFNSDHGLPQTASRVGMSFGLTMIL